MNREKKLEEIESIIKEYSHKKNKRETIKFLELKGYDKKDVSMVYDKMYGNLLSRTFKYSILFFKSEFFYIFIISVSIFLITYYFDKLHLFVWFHSLFTLYIIKRIIDLSDKFESEYRSDIYHRRDMHFKNISYKKEDNINFIKHYGTLRIFQLKFIFLFFVIAASFIPVIGSLIIASTVQILKFKNNIDILN